MSWDRVIQDSDEEEPFVADNIPTSVDSIQDHGPSMQPHCKQPPGEQSADYLIGQTTQDPAEAQLSVNFDQYLQSEEGAHPAITLSQQQREERWIPSTGEGGGGSLGAMMNEINLAQQRLLDEESSVGQHPPSTTTIYPSEISQPGSYPTMATFEYQQTGDVQGTDLAYVPKLRSISSEATQLVAPVHAPTYDYSTPAASTHVDSPFEGTSEQVTTFTSSTHLNEGTHVTTWSNTTQQAKLLQPTTYSPHDTEPLSSVASLQLNRANGDPAGSGLISPQHSPASTHDELSMPVVSVEVPTPAVKKKRGRPRKQAMPENDDDDELALPQDSGSGYTSTTERNVEPDTHGASDGAPAKNANAVMPVYNSIAIDGASDTNAEPTKPAANEPKKRKIKRSKTASAVLQKPHKPDIDDDVIWVDSRPLHVEDSNDNTQSKSPNMIGIALTLSDSGPSTSTEDNPFKNQGEPQNAPKKRGRKRKKTAEQLAPVETASTESQPATDVPPPETNMTVDDCTTEPIAQTDNKVTAPGQSADTTTYGNPTFSTTELNEPTPQTPLRDETPIEAGAIGSAQKGPIKHSPISSTSKVPFRVGLSRRARIAPLLKVVRK